MPDSHLDVYIRPPTALEDAAARARANDLAGTTMQLSMGQLLTDKFLQRHTLFVSVPDLVSGVGFDVYEVNVDALPDPFQQQLNGYLRNNSKFDSWDSLLLQATADWVTGYLHGSHELDGPPANYASLSNAETVGAAEIKGPLENIDFRKISHELMAKLFSLGLVVYASYQREPPVYVMEIGNVKFVFALHVYNASRWRRASHFRLVGQAPANNDTRTLAELFVLDAIEQSRLQFNEAALEFGVSLLPLGAAAIAFQKEGITSMEGWVSLGADVAGVLTFGATKGINSLRAAKTAAVASRSVMTTLKTAATANMLQLVFRGERALRNVQITGLALMGGELVFRGVEAVAAAIKGDALTTAGKAGEVILRLITLRAARRAVKDSQIGGFAQPAKDYKVPDDILEFVNGSPVRGQGYEADINRAVITRMRKLGIPEESIGLKARQFFGNPFETHSAIGGGNMPKGLHVQYPGINVDYGVLDSNFRPHIPSWSKAPWKDRLDAVIAHEWAEVHSPRTDVFYVNGSKIPGAHYDALAQAPFTKLPISELARQILLEELQAAPGGMK